MLKLITLIFFSLFISNINAQNWTKVDSVFAPGGVTVQDFSAPVFGDLDADGDYDLVLGNIELEIEYFENVGTLNEPEFRKDESMFTSIYAGGYQFTNSDYPFLADLDDDNDLDLIIGGYNGLKYYENTGDSISPEWQFDSLFTLVNEEIGTDPKPAFTDLDDDGDLDLVVGIGESLLGGPEAGICMGFRNTGSAKEPVYTRDDDLVSGIIDVGINAYPAFADLNNDRDYDLLLGRDGSTLFYYENTGTPSVPAWTLRNTPFNVVETTNYWKDPSFVDLDGDLDFDLVYGTADGDLYYYENTGSVTTPQFQRNTSYFKVIKADGYSTVSFADYDNDGDYDLLSGSVLGKLMYAQNDGSASIPLFTETTSGFTNINPGFRSAAVFLDIDNDGDQDIVSGYSSGTLILYENDNGSFTADPGFFTGIQVGYGSIPAFADIDNDGDYDLLVGSDDPNDSKFYINDGNNNFTQDNTVFAGVTFPRGSAPAFADIDNDEDYDLFIGETFGSVEFYENTGTKSEPEWQINNDLLEGIEVKQNPRPGFADLDDDGRIDMILGEADGNFTFYKNNFAPTSVGNENEIVKDYNLFQNYPNPFNPETKIKYQLPSDGHVKIIVYDMLGREVKTLIDEFKNSGNYSVEFDAGSLASGIYIYKLQAGNIVLTKKMILQK